MDISIARPPRAPYKACVYQSIDDPNDEFEGEGEARSLLWPVLALCVAAAIVFAVVFLTSPGRPALPGEEVPDAQSRAAYLTAISEPTAALRRARLRDFLATYPDHPRGDVALGQIDAIDRHDLRDWEALGRITYDTRRPRAEKLAAIEDYETRWGGTLLGGRGAEITALREEVMGMAEAVDRPDRRLKDRPSPIPDTITADMMVGGPVEIYRPKPRPATIVPPPAEVTRDVVVKPTVRRNVAPRYPRRAKRRGVEAVVILRLDIDEEGRVQETELVSVNAERYEESFVKAAERAALRTRFNPKTVNGVAVEAKGMTKRYRFVSG